MSKHIAIAYIPDMGRRTVPELAEQGDDLFLSFKWHVKESEYGGFILNGRSEDGSGFERLVSRCNALKATAVMVHSLTAFGDTIPEILDAIHGLWKACKVEVTFRDGNFDCELGKCREFLETMNVLHIELNKAALKRKSQRSK